MRIEDLISLLKVIQKRNPGIEVVAASTAAPCEHYGTGKVAGVKVETEIGSSKKVVMIETSN